MLVWTAEASNPLACEQSAGEFGNYGCARIEGVVVGSDDQPLADAIVGPRDPDALVRPKGRMSALSPTVEEIESELEGLGEPEIAEAHGRHLRNRDRSILYGLARSNSVWERRIAIMPTVGYVKAGSFEETLRLAGVLLSDPHDLIHKVVGWMLRRVGKRDRGVAEAFLRPRYRRMPRTMLHYAIEKYPAALRQQYLRGEVEA